MGRGVWQATVHGITKSRTQLKQLSTHAQYSSVYFVDGLKDLKVEKEMRISYTMAVCYCQNGKGWRCLRQLSGNPGLPTPPGDSKPSLSSMCQ